MKEPQRSLFDGDPEASAVAAPVSSTENVGAPRPAALQSESGERCAAQCVVEMRYHTGRLAVPVGPVTVETSGRIRRIYVGGHVMLTLDAVDQAEKFEKHIQWTLSN